MYGPSCSVLTCSCMSAAYPVEAVGVVGLHHVDSEGGRHHDLRDQVVRLGHGAATERGDDASVDTRHLDGGSGLYGDWSTARAYLDVVVLAEEDRGLRDEVEDDLHITETP